jgi:gliding motility-associated-like protein
MKTTYLIRLLGHQLALLIVSFWGISSFTQYGYSQTEESGMVSKPNNYKTFDSNRLSSQSLPYNAPCSECEEDISARTEFTKTYNGTGSKKGYIYTQSGYSPLHIKDKNGNWITFDARLRKQSHGVYTAQDQHSPVTIDMNTGICSILNSDGEIKFNNKPELFWKTDTEITSLGKADFTNHTAGDDGVYVTDVWPGIDMEMRAFMGSIKTNFIIKNRPSQTTGVFIIRDEMKLANQLTLQKYDNELRVETASGDEAFSISSCVGYDKHPSRENGIQLFNYEVNGTTVDIVLPLAILNAPEFVYPYTVDPLVNSSNTLAQASITGSTYGATCFSNYCPYNLNVATPANAVLVDALWSFNYQASGFVCYMSDGAVTFMVGTCASPNTAGYYWFCNSSSSGTCTGSNISMFSHISSCLPAPSCTPQNVSFQMRFYRCWSSGSGCSNNCISAASPWTVTLVGQTVNYSNTTTPITVSSATVCQGQSITASTTATFGVPPYTYNWSFSPSGSPSVGSGNSASITFPTAGTQTLYSIVTDACGNQVNSSIVVTVTNGPTVTATPNPANICSGSSPNITLSSTPAGATFNWTATQSNVTGASAGSGANINQTLTASGTSSGTATYNVVGTIGSCPSAGTNVIVNVNPTPTATISGGGSYCTGGTIPSITIQLTGTAPWSVGVSDGTTTQTLSINSSPYTYNPTGPGTYTITSVSDAGCPGTGTGSATITVNPLDNATFNYSSVTFCTTGTNPTPTLANPSMTGTFSGTGVVFTNPANGTIDLAGTGAGTYTITFTTTGPCPNTSSQTITIISGPDPSFTYTSPVCPSGTNPLPQLNPGAVSGTYSATPTGLSLNSSTGEINLTASTPGTYTVTNTIAASGGCSAVSQTATITISPAPTATISGGGSYCTGGTIPSITIQLTGTAPWSVGLSDGTTTQTLSINSSPYTYNPTGPGTYTITSVSDAGCSGTGSGSATVTVTPLDDAAFTYSSATFCTTGSNPTPTLNTPSMTGTFSGVGVAFTNTANGTIDLVATGVGTYTVTFTTSGPCPNTSSQTITITTSPDASFTYTSPVCQSGTNPLPQLNPGAVNGTYSATPTGLSLNSSTGEISLSASTPGTYTVTNTIAAAGGCSAVSQTATITISPSPTATISGGGGYCTGGTIPSITIQLTGTAPWSVVLSDGTTTQTLSINASPYTYNPTGPGTYTITSVNSAGCSGTGTGSATVTVNPTPTVNPVNNITACANNTVNVPAFIGSPAGTSFTWTNSSTLIGLGASGNGNISSFTGTNSTTTPISGQITVTPSLNGCAGTPINFTITIHPIPSPTITGTTVYCTGAPVSNLTATPSVGGQITWYSNSGLTAVVGNGTTFTPSASTGSTTYYVTETSNGCVSNPVSVTVTIHPLTAVSAGPDKTQCAGTPVILSGNGAISYTWSNGVVNGQSFTQPVGSITYTVTGTDVNGCTNTDQVVVTIVSSPVINVTNTQNVSCFGLTDGSVTVNVTGGSPNYTYNWSPSGGNGATASNLSPGSYTLTVTDAIGCTDNETVTIIQPNQLTVTSTITDYSCGITDGEINLAVTGGTGTYTYTWSPNVSTTNIATGLTGGSYSVIVTDAQGCTQSLQMTVGTIEGDLISVSADSYIINEGETTILHAEGTPGVVYDSIVWSPATGLSCTNCTDPIASPSGTMTYYATLYSPDGCTDTDTLIISVSYPCSEVFVATLFSPNSDGLNDVHCVRGSCIAKLEFLIFDRWGEVVFESTDQDDCWDGNFRGKPAQTGVYIYKLTAILDDGSTFTDSGNINLIR